MKIIVADDSPANGKLTVMMLKRLGHEVDAVENGQELLERLECQRADVVFVDVHMPILDGIEASKAIAQRWSEADRPKIVALTASACESDRRECLEAGMDAFLAKPVRLEELQAVITRLTSSAARSNAGVDLSQRSEPAPEWEKAVRSRLAEAGLLDSPRTAADVLSDFLLAADRLAILLTDAPAAGNAETLLQTVHALKGLCANLGFETLAARCEELELHLRGGSAAYAQGMRGEIVARYMRLRPEVIRFRTRLLTPSYDGDRMTNLSSAP